MGNSIPWETWLRQVRFWCKPSVGGGLQYTDDNLYSRWLAGESSESVIAECQGRVKAKPRRQSSPEGAAHRRAQAKARREAVRTKKHVAGRDKSLAAIRAFRKSHASIAHDVYQNLSHEARDLALFMENDYPTHQQEQAFEKSVLTKVDRGTYDPSKAPKLWIYLVERGVRRYAEDSRSDPAEYLRIYSPTARREVAELYATSFDDKLLSGEAFL